MSYLTFVNYCKKFDKSGFSKGLKMLTAIDKVADKFNWKVETQYRDDGKISVWVKDCRSMSVCNEEGEGIVDVFSALLEKIIRKARNEMESLNSVLNEADSHLTE